MAAESYKNGPVNGNSSKKKVTRLASIHWLSSWHHVFLHLPVDGADVWSLIFVIFFTSLDVAESFSIRAWKERGQQEHEGTGEKILPPKLVVSSSPSAALRPLECREHCSGTVSCRGFHTVASAFIRTKHDIKPVHFHDFVICMLFHNVCIGSHLETVVVDRREQKLMERIIVHARGVGVHGRFYFVPPPFSFLLEDSRNLA